MCDICFKYLKNEFNVYDNIVEDLYMRFSKVFMEDISGLISIMMNINKSDFGEFKMNGFVDEIVELNNYMIYLWMFFLMFGSDEVNMLEEGVFSYK